MENERCSFLQMKVTTTQKGDIQHEWSGQTQMLLLREKKFPLEFFLDFPSLKLDKWAQHEWFGDFETQHGNNSSHNLTWTCGRWNSLRTDWKSADFAVTSWTCLFALCVFVFFFALNLSLSGPLYLMLLRFQLTGHGSVPKHPNYVPQLPDFKYWSFLSLFKRLLSQFPVRFITSQMAPNKPQWECLHCVFQHPTREEKVCRLWELIRDSHSSTSASSDTNRGLFSNTNSIFSLTKSSKYWHINIDTRPINPFALIPVIFFCPTSLS